MFRQVVVQTWARGVTSEQKQAMNAGLAALRQIPEVVSARGGTDGGYFAGNWGSVAVLDFADLDSARRYVGHPAHQAFIAEYSRPLTDQRAVVQYEWGAGSIVGYHHVKVPVSDVARSRQWYVSVLGFEPDMEFSEDGVLRGVALHHPIADVLLALRHDPARAAALAGFDVTAMAVGTRRDLALVAGRATAAGAAAGPVEPGRQGWTCDLVDPDGLIVRLYTHERRG